jgi:hypothetical protein
VEKRNRATRVNRSGWEPATRLRQRRLDLAAGGRPVKGGVIGS